MVSILKLLTILFRQATLRFTQVLGSDCSSFNAIKIASANACGFLGFPTQPVSPTICAASPTSVVTQGVLQAIASAKTLGKASLLEDSTCRSRLLMMVGISLR